MQPISPGRVVTPAAFTARRRPAAWAAVGLMLVSLGMVAFMLVSLVLPGWEQLSSRPQNVAEWLGVLASLFPMISLPTVGAIVAIRRPANPIGWLLLAGAVGLIFGFFAPEYVQRSIVLESRLPGYRLMDWLYPAVQGIGFMLMFVWLPLLFPDGRLPGPRWRPIAGTAAAAMALSAIVVLVTEEDDDFGRQLPNPIALDERSAEVAALLNSVATILIVGLVVLALLSVVLRLRRATDIGRQQLKWFLAAAAMVFAAMVAMILTYSDWAFFASLAAIGTLPVAIGIAVLRYRLYEIDRLISRTIGWGLVTGLLVGTFALLVVSSSALFEPVTGGNTLAVAGSTLVVVGLFAPIRHRVQAAVDRRFDRSRYDGERLLVAFGERLRDEVDIDVIRADVLETVDRAVRPAGVGLWLRRRPGHEA